MRARANGMGRSPKNRSAADPNEAAAGAGGRPAPRGVKSPLESSDVESAMKARQVAVTDRKSPLAERLAVLPTLGLEDLRREWRRLSRPEPPELSRDIMMRAIAYPMAGNRPRRFVQSHATSAHDPGEPTRNRWADRSAPRTQDQIRLAPDPGMAWPNPHGYHSRRGFRVPGQNLSVADPDRLRNYRSQMVRAAILRLDAKAEERRGRQKNSSVESGLGWRRDKGG